MQYKSSILNIDGHQRLIMLYVWYKFHRILFTAYLVTADFVNLKLIQVQ